MDGILVSIFLGFWSILGGKLGGKPEPRSTQKGIEKRCEKEEQRECQKRRNKNLQRPATGRVLGPGEVTPLRSGKPPPTSTHGGTKRSTGLFLATKVQSCLAFVLPYLVLPCLSPVLPCLPCLVVSWLDFLSQLGSENL